MVAFRHDPTEKAPAQDAGAVGEDVCPLKAAGGENWLEDIEQCPVDDDAGRNDKESPVWVVFALSQEGGASEPDQDRIHKDVGSFVGAKGQGRPVRQGAFRQQRGECDGDQP